MASENPWSASEPLTGAVADARDPALALVEEIPHAVWSRNKIVYHATHSAGKWSEPRKVHPGEHPVLATAPDGRLHCLFKHSFNGNDEVFHLYWDGSRWSLPQIISRTSGASSRPALATGPDGMLHAAWTDTTPGYPVIYYARREKAGWVNAPIPSGRGSNPAVGVAPDGATYVAWHDRHPTTRKFEVFCAIRMGATWSLPQTISDSAERHSLAPQLAANALGVCHLVWQEERGNGAYGIAHAAHFPNGWTSPADVSATSADCRLARVQCNRQGLPQVIWSEGRRLRHRHRSPAAEETWFATEDFVDGPTGVSNLTLAISRSGVTHVMAARYEGAATLLPYYAFRKPLFKQSTFVPAG